MVLDGKTLQIRAWVNGCPGCQSGSQLLTGVDADHDGFDDLIYASPGYDDKVSPFPDGKITIHLTQ